MSEVSWIELVDFRCLTTARLEPVPDGLTVVVGKNGAGKTSLLEAIGYASSLKSFRLSPRDALIRNGQQQAFIRTEVVNAGRKSLIEIEISTIQRDRALLNKQRVTKSNDLLEIFRVTVFTPDDLVLIKGGPSERRTYIDDSLTDARPKYLALCQNVDRVLRQRNTLLKQGWNKKDDALTSSLDVWDFQLAKDGAELVSAREAMLAEIEPIAAAAFQRLTRIDEPLRLIYQPSFDGDFASALENARQDDLRRGVTTVGPHRDEISIEIGDLDARTRLSQGQQRSVTLALRLATHAVVTEHAGSPPILLLDDAFSELDELTTKALVAEMPRGQALLTTAGNIPDELEPSMMIGVSDGVIG